MEHGIILAPEILTRLGPLPITNTMIVSWLVTGILCLSAIIAGKRTALIPSGFYNFFETIIEAGYDTVLDIAHSKTRVFFPFLMTFFLYIIVANWFGLFPGFGTIGFFESEGFVPILRSINSDLNMTLGLALVSAGLTHYYAVKYLGFGGYLQKFFSLNPILLFVGLLELVSEVTKIVSLSFRLFGNIFAGEVVLSTVSNLVAFIVPLPFMFLEIIVGFVQAAVFMMLTLVFMSLLSEKHEEH